MKQIMFLACIGTLTLALTAAGAPNKPATKSARKTVSAHAISGRGGSHAMRSVAPVRTSRGYSAARVRTAPMNGARIHARNNVAGNHERSINRATTLRNSHVMAARTANPNTRVHPRNNVAVNRERNINRANTLQNSRVAAARTANTNLAVNNQRNARIVNNWRSDRFSGQNYAAFRDYRRQWHDHNWWRSHYSRIILVSGGWWFWDAGYWYPAWGYDPYYTYYPYDGPIYGYGDLTPDQVIVNVQTQLRNDGYYVGAVDGVLGPQTRRAIAAFQADHGLAVTSAVDEPTLTTLGLT